jgi:YD repeat-containing protein
MFCRLAAIVLMLKFVLVGAAEAQVQTSAGSDAVRVTVSQNNDGSQTTYEMDPANRKATATTVSARGKPMGKIRYVLDAEGRYESGEVLGADDRLQFKTQYKYDVMGRLQEETRLNKENAVTMRIVYAYDPAGKPAGYSVYDPAGKLLGQTTPKLQPPPAAPAKKAR